MSWLSGNIAARLLRESRHVSQPGAEYVSRTVSGVSMTPDRAMRIATVWACVRYIGQSMGQLPARVLQDVPGRRPKHVDSHPVSAVLNWRPNPEMPPFSFKETMVSWGLKRGNGIAEITKNLVGSVTELWPIDPSRVNFVRDAETDELLYEIDDIGGTKHLRTSDVLHIRGMGDGPVGMSVMEYASQSLGWTTATELFGAAFFGNGMHFGGFIEAPNVMDEKSQAQLLGELERKNRGVARAGRWT